MGGAKKCVLDGAFGSLENFGDRFQLQAMVVFQLENHAFARRKVSQGTNDVLLQYAACEVALEARANALIGYAVQEYLLLAIWGICCGQFAASGAFPAKVIEAKIRGNAIDPRIKRALETKAWQIHVGAQKSFLIDVLTVLLRAGEVNGEAENGPVVLLDELLEGSRTALLRCPNQLCVVRAIGAGLFRHGHR